MAIVLDPGTELDVADVAAALVSQGLPKFKLPEELVIWAEPLPVNANGKVERRKLAALSGGRQRLLARRLGDSSCGTG